MQAFVQAGFAVLVMGSTYIVLQTRHAPSATKHTQTVATLALDPVSENEIRIRFEVQSFGMESVDLDGRAMLQWLYSVHGGIRLEGPKWEGSNSSFV